jgi:hypothetical protein
LTMCHWSDHDPSSALGGVRCRHDTARVLYSDPMHAPGIPLYYYSIIICIYCYALFVLSSFMSGWGIYCNRFGARATLADYKMHGNVELRRMTRAAFGVGPKEWTRCSGHSWKFHSGMAGMLRTGT